MTDDMKVAGLWFGFCWILLIALCFCYHKIYQQQREIENLTNSNTVLMAQCANQKRIMEFKSAQFLHENKGVLFK